MLSNSCVRGQFIVLLLACILLGTGCIVPAEASQPLPTFVPTAAMSFPSPTAQGLLPTPTLAEALIQPTFTAVSVANLPEQTTEPFAEPTAAVPSPTATAVPTETAVPTITPTSAPQSNPVLWVNGPTGGENSAIPIPTAVSRFNIPADTTNILLLGNDGGVNTDTMIIVAINKEGPTASMISLPRDLFVYIPGVNMGRLNTAAAIGGVDLLKQTILYNFGVPIHYYARVNFDGFKETVNILGGVEIAASCALRDWKLIAPSMNPELEESWEMFILQPGVHQMDGDLALWYARSRLTTSDFERGRRQQQIIRAIFNQAVDLGKVTELPSLWSTYQDYIETDMDIGRMLQLATLAPAVRENGIQHLYLAGKTQPWTTPSGAWVQLPVWDGYRMMGEEFSRLFMPPALDMSAQTPITVEIINASGNPDLTALAADNLAWFGFIPIEGELQLQPVATTTLNYYQPNFKGSYDWLISWVFDMPKEAIQLADSADYPYDYQVILGQDYNPCRPQMYAPQLFLR